MTSSKDRMPHGGGGVQPEVLVVGTLAFDDVETPSGRRDGIFGGSATYFALAASLFVPTAIVGVVGEDFPEEFRDLLGKRGVDLGGVTTIPGGRTFHWSGRYGGAMNEAETLRTDLNVLADFDPQLLPRHASTPYVFLANTDPRIQGSVLGQMRARSLVALDSMNFWIENARDSLLHVLREVDGAILNDAEVRRLSGHANLIAAGKWLLQHGPRRFVVLKRGEYGSVLLTPRRIFALPSFPVAEVVDPTGAGDTFAGGFLGRLAENRFQTEDLDDSPLCDAMLYATALASFTVEAFGSDLLLALDRAVLEDRTAALRAIVTP